MLQKLLSLLWYNDTYRVAFTNHKTRNKDEYLWFTKDIKTGVRSHHYYTVFEDCIIIQYDGKEYTCIELKPRFITECMIQLVNIDKPADIINFMGTDMPVIHGTPYLMQGSTLQHG